MVEQFANNATTTLSSGINASVTAIPLTSSQKFSATGNFRIVIDSELMLVTANNTGTNTLTVLRGQEGTAAVSHSSGANVSQIVTAGAITQMKLDTITVRTLSSTKTTTYTILSSDDIVLYNTSGGSFNIFLPATPISGEQHTILDVGGSNGGKPLTISGNGNNLVTAAGILSSSDSISTNYLPTVYLWNGSFWSLL